MTLYIGVDNGFGNTKGNTTVLPSGVKKLSVKPPVAVRSIEYAGEFYAVGGQKLSIQKSKVENEETLILTLAVIAEELKKKGLTTADVRLGVGLPLMRMGAEKVSFQEYMLRNRRLNFRYEDKSYSIFLTSVDVFPQGYAAVVDKLRTFSVSTVVIDVGSWTIDVLPIVENVPDLSRCKSLNLGTITAMQEINERLRQKFNVEAEEALIKEVMISGTSLQMEACYLSIIQEGLETYVEEIMAQLRSLKINSELMQLVFVGGGASIIKNFCKEKNKNIVIIEDICINAKGYETLLAHKYNGR